MTYSNPYFAGVEGSVRRQIYKGSGFDDHDLRGLHIGVGVSWTEASPGTAHMKQLAEAVKAGIWQAGGMPLEFGLFATCGNVALGAPELKYELVIRDVVAASVEIMAKEHKFDGMVLLGACDSFLPGELMGAFRVDIPTIIVTAGSMLPGKYRGQTLTSSDLNEMAVGGKISEAELLQLEGCACPAAGACPVMGTANTMQILTEVLGMTLSGTATIPAVLADRYRAARACGRAAVELARHKVRPSQIVSRASLINAAIATLAIGGSTNAVLHLVSLARELGIDFTQDIFDELGRSTPCILGVAPNGPYNVVDFNDAGAVPVLLKHLAPLLHKAARTVDGGTIGDIIDRQEARPSQVLRTLDDPISATGGLAILKGALAPDGAVVRLAGGHEFVFTGTARVFNSDEEGLDAIYRGEITPGTVMILRYEGPQGAPGMREMMLSSDALVAQGLAEEVVLITDGRFSGFNHGRIIGHVSPEAEAGGPIALVQNGDLITVDVPNRRMDLHVEAAELAQRKAAWAPPARKAETGILGIYKRLCRPAHEGAAIQF